jgi:multidrug efflux pump subunit AcrB
MYGQTLGTVLRHSMLTLLVMALTITLTISLYVKVPKGYFPQDDTGLLIGATQASSDISFKGMSDLQERAAAIVGADPAVASVGSSIGTSTFNPSINQGRLFISLKPLWERKLNTTRIVDRLRRELAGVTGLQVFLVQAQDLRVGARSSKSQYQFTLWSSDIEELTRWTPKILEQVRKIPGLIDVSTDREQGGLQANLVIDRLAAARLCVNVQDIDNALGNAFAQAQISTIYGARNQYRVILEIDRQYQRDPSSLNYIFVRASGSASGNSGCADAIAMAQAINAATGVISGISPNEVPLSAVARFEKALAPLVVNHLGQFPSVTITYNLASNIGLEEANARIQRAVTDLHLPGTIHSEVAGDVKAFAQTVGAQPLLLVAALIAVYIVLGVLYESLAHPITIISTLPSAGLGALLALQFVGGELTVIAFIGIILLIGIVKKNGIMMVDFALEAERRRGFSPERAIFEACLERFRPILMTTMAALLGAVPLALAIGPGSELRRPLGITIIGGLLVSQVLTLYTTPVIYLLLGRLHHRLWPSALTADAEGHRR